MTVTLTNKLRLYQKWKKHVPSLKFKQEVPGTPLTAS